VGIVIASDGWSDRCRRPLLNFIATSPAGSRFVSALDTSGDTKTAAYMATAIGRVVEELGVERVVAVVTDNAANVKAAGEELMNKYPRLCWLPCTAHVLDLLLEDICKLGWVQSAIAKCRELVVFITTHQWSDALVKQLALNGSKKQLLKPGE
jgi:hypothetical protein